MAQTETTSQEDEEALRLMMEESTASMPDRRSEGDPHWLANGAQVELFGLEKAKTLNGQTGEIIGFDDEVRRYRVRLHSDETVKVVAKKNFRPLPVKMPSFPAAPENNIPAVGSQGLASSSGSRQPSTDAAPTRDIVRLSIQKIRQETSGMLQRCAARQGGGGHAVTADISDTFLRMNSAVEVYEEVLKAYQQANGKDEELETEGAAAVASFEECCEQYYALRTWKEMAQDEWNLTQHSIRKHGVLGTLKNDLVDVGSDVADLTQSASGIIQTGRQALPQVVRSTTANLGSVMQSTTTAAAATTGGLASRAQQHIANAIEEQIVAPVKRTWKLMVTAFLLCFLVPLFGLRTYAPLNSVVSNLGLVYAMVCLMCPPMGLRQRSSKAGLLVLYPVFTVALPLGLHYWATHPDMLARAWPSKAIPSSEPVLPDITLQKELKSREAAKTELKPRKTPETELESKKASETSNIGESETSAVAAQNPVARWMQEVSQVSQRLMQQVSQVFKRPTQPARAFMPRIAGHAADLSLRHAGTRRIHSGRPLQRQRLEA
eukprot:TRINITY_DN64134_c0_g1_i1.p1 TRINITY_DN64134_c0_g1~~TRINITY_DN64134_c0_g1_i1.p1  ORF type:complete len:548 (-),score=111.56 TRINITY_DN64134_c0_g1_i1:246-1889(-)